MRSARAALVAVASVLAVAGGLGWTMRDRGDRADAGPAGMAGDPAAAALPDLLGQVYRAYALTDEAAIHDALSQAAQGGIVTDLYLQRRRAQVADHAEDGQTRILSVEVYQVAPLPEADADSDAEAYHVAWRVVGRVQHAGHVHERINLYAADLALAQVGGAWKLTGFTLTQAARADDMDFEGGE